MDPFSFFRKKEVPGTQRQLLEEIYKYQKKNARYAGVWLWLYVIFIVLPISLAIIGVFLASQKVAEFTEKTDLPGVDAIVESFEDFQQWQLSVKELAGPDMTAEFKEINERLKNIEKTLAK